MDPEQCIKDMARLHHGSMTENALDLLQHMVDYREWRRKGGFEPFAGADAQARSYAVTALSALMVAVCK